MHGRPFGLLLVRLSFPGSDALCAGSHKDIFLFVCFVCLFECSGLSGLVRAKVRRGLGFRLVRLRHACLHAGCRCCLGSGLAGGKACGPGSFFKLLQSSGCGQELFLGLAQLGLQILGTGRQGRGLWLFRGRCPGDRGVFLGSRRLGGKGCPGIRILGCLCLFLAVTDRRCSLVHREILNHVAAGKRSPQGNGQLAGL